MVGPPGVGKSHLAQAIGYALIKSGKTVLYRSVFDVVAELGIEAENPMRHQKAMKAYLRCDLLIIDDMGIKVLPPKSSEHLFEIIMRRYELKSTLMTSNRPIEEWANSWEKSPPPPPSSTASSTTPRSSRSPVGVTASKTAPAKPNEPTRPTRRPGCPRESCGIT